MDCVTGEDKKGNAKDEGITQLCLYLTIANILLSC